MGISLLDEISNRNHQGKDEFPTILKSSYSDLFKLVRPGQIISFDNGSFECKVIKVCEGKIHAKSMGSFAISSPASISLPDSPCELPLISNEDLNALLSFLKSDLEIEYLSLPHVRCA